MVLKALGFITLSWWWVTAPLWGFMLLTFVLLTTVHVSGIIVRWYAQRKRAKNYAKLLAAIKKIT